MLILFVWIFCGVISAIIASNKRRSTAGWFLWGVIFGPFAIITVAVLRQLTPNEAARAAGGPRALLPEPHVNAVHTKPCPRCAEDVKIAALACRFCGYDFIAARTEAMPPK